MGADDDTKRDGEDDEQQVNLFTISALRLHRTRLPPTPGKEESLRARLKRLISTASRYVRKLKG